MKQKLLTIKTLLVAAGLCVGASAWADTGSATVKMTYVDQYNDNADNSFGEIAAGSYAKAGASKISSGSLTVANSYGVHYITYLQVDASSIPGTITGASLSIEVGASLDKGRNTEWGVGYNSSTWSNSLTYNTCDRSITTMGTTQWTTQKKTKGSYEPETFETKEFDISAALVGDADKIATILIYELQAGGGNIKNPSVTITYTTGTTVTYTINYTYGGEIIDSESATVAENEVVTATKSSVWNTGSTQKYYVTDAATTSFTVKADDYTFEVPLRLAETQTATINAIDGESNVLKSFTKSVFEGEKTWVFFTRVVEKDGVFYAVPAANAAADGNYGWQVNAGATSTKTFTADATISYYYEENELTASHSFAESGQATGRASGGDWKRIYKGAYHYTPALRGGVYTVEVAGRGQNSSGLDLGIYVYANGSLGANKGTVSYTNSTISVQSVAGIEVPDGASIAIKNDDESNNSNVAFDYIILRRTGDYTVSVPVTSAGYATYCSPYALDFSGVSENVKAYFITGAEGNSLTLSEALSTVPANQGVLLIGAEDNYNIPVIASSSTDATENKLIGVTAETADVAAGIYVLMDETNGVGFYKTTSAFTVGANTAYLPADIAGARAFYGFGDATAISAVKTVKADGEVYNLNGQRVAAPQKGLYIVNGKKVIIK